MLLIGYGSMAFATETNHKNQDDVRRTALLKQFLADSAKQREQKLGDQHNIVQQVSAKVEKLTDATGLVYIGATIESNKLAPYLRQMIGVLGTEKFALYRANQADRDNHSFHLTLINPFELQKLQKPVQLGQSIAITLQGLGMAKAPTSNSQAKAVLHQSYFVVASSTDGEFYRQQYALSAKHFHVTLGFNPSDVFGVDKSSKALVYANKVN